MAAHSWRWLAMVLMIAGLRSDAVMAQRQVTSPDLMGWPRTVNIAPDKALDRAEAALLAAGLQLNDRTAITHGGFNRDSTVIIYCRGANGQTMVDVMVATNTGHGAELMRLGEFLTRYMETGQNPDGAPDLNTFGGTWFTDFGEMHLTQQGNQVTGTYDYDGGKITGTVTDNVLRFQWTQNGGNGSGRFMLGPGGKTFNGFWYRGDDPAAANNTWNGTRSMLKGTQTSLRTDKEVYAADENIPVEFANFPGNVKDWLTIVNANDPPEKEGQFFYAGGKKSGVFTFKGLPVGDYEVRGFYNWPDGGHTVQVRVPFRVR
jgi:hypothetical protein